MSANKTFVKKDFISNLGERAAKVNERTDDELLKLREMKINLEKEIEGLKEDKIQIVRLKENLECENKNLERNSDVLRAEVEMQNNSIASNAKEVQRLIELRESLNVEVDVSSSIVEKLQGEEKILVENQEQLEGHCKALKVEIGGLTQKQDTLRDELLKLNGLKAAMIDENATLTVEKEKLINEIQNYKEELSILEDKKQKATLQLSMTIKDINEKALKVDDLNLNIIELEKAREQRIVDLEKVEDGLKQLNEEKEREKSALKLIIDQASEEKKNIDEMEKEKSNLQSDIHLLQERIGGLNPYQVPDDIKLIALEEVKTTIFLPRIDKDVLKFQAQVNKGDMKIELPQLLRSGLNKKYYEILEKVYREQVESGDSEEVVEHN